VGSSQEDIKLTELFARAAFEVDNRRLTGLTGDTVISQLGLDSVTTMELIAYFEEKLEIHIPDEELGRVRTLSDLRDIVARLVPPGLQVTL
jgi:acyl carrier protein